MRALFVYLRLSWVVLTLWVGSAPAQQDVSNLIVEEVVKDSPAQKAGVQVGDGIVSYDKKWLVSPVALEAAEQNTFGKKEAILEVRRGENTLKLTVPLGKLGIQTRPELTARVGKLYEEGRAASRAKDTKGAEEKWESAAKLARQDGSRGVAAWLYMRLGNALESESQWKKAGEAYQAAWELIRQKSDSAAQSRTLAALGRCSQSESDFAAAESWLTQARQVDVASASQAWEAGDLNGLGVVANLRGDVNAAQEYISRAFAIRERLTPGSLDVATSLNNLGIMAETRGDLAAAQEYHSRALAIRERITPNSLDVAISLNNLGNIVKRRGDLASAADYYSRSLAIFERLAPNSLNFAGSLNNLGNVAEDRGDWAAAQEYFERGLAVSERLAPNSSDVAVKLNNLGNLAKDRGDWATAQDYFMRSLAILERLAPDSCNVAVALHNLGETAFSRADLAAAQKYYGRALAIWERIAPKSLDLAEVLTNLGKVAYKQHRFADAESLLSRAIGIIESQRVLISQADARSLLLAEYISSYAELLRVHLALQDLPAAFNTAERARGRGLLDLLAEAHIDVREAIEPALLQRERALQEELNARALRQTRLLQGQHTDKEAAAVAQEINSLTAEFQEAQAAIRASNPRYAALTKPQPLSLEEIQEQVLDKDSLLLEYALGEDASYLFAVTQTSIQYYELPKRKEIEALSRQLYDALTARNQHGASERQLPAADAEYPQLAKRLSRMILSPAAAELGNKRLLIVADGILLQIPFAVLADPAADGAQPLLVAHEIVNLPSASVLAEQRRELAGRKPAARQLALLADPVFQAEDERVNPLRSIRSLEDAKRTRASAEPENEFAQALREVTLNDGRSGIQRLVFSRREAETISAYAEHSDVLKALDFDASKKTASDGQLSQYRIVHFATHALLNNDHPELSGIVLSLFDRQGRSVDGFLRLNEIYNLNLSADLVVLSACQTALGREVKGEGVIGLTRGFFYAGAERVVGSLWKVDDAATAELMGHFYEKMLKGGEPAAAALRHAQLDLMGQHRWGSAYFWAAFTIQGEWK